MMNVSLTCSESAVYKSGYQEPLHRSNLDPRVLSPGRTLGEKLKSKDVLDLVPRSVSCTAANGGDGSPGNEISVTESWRGLIIEPFRLSVKNGPRNIITSHWLHFILQVGCGLIIATCCPCCKRLQYSSIPASPKATEPSSTTVNI